MRSAKLFAKGYEVIKNANVSFAKSCEATSAATMALLWSFLTTLLCLLGTHTATATSIERRQDSSATHNNFACRSPFHPNPVVVLHGILANAYTGINALYDFLGTQGFCTFSATYGAFLPGVLPIDFGGVTSISQSSAEVAAFILQVLASTGASQVDIVGHSEGAFMALYVPKFYPYLQPYIRSVVAVGPPTHGTTISGIYEAAYIFGETSRRLIGDFFEAVGCGACDDLGPEGPAVIALNTGPIAQPGIQYTIIASQFDEIITPTTTAFVFEPGVVNLYIQQYCPADASGHAREPYSPNIQAVVANALNGYPAGPAVCSAGPDLITAITGVLAFSGGSDLTLFQELEQKFSDIVGGVGFIKR